MGYSRAAMERAMKVQEVILRAISKQMTWWQAAEVLRIESAATATAVLALSDLWV